MEYVVDRFHGRSLALAHSREEIEELDLQNNDETLTGEKFVFIISLKISSKTLASFPVN
jgi:hypothetical protein